MVGRPLTARRAYEIGMVHEVVAAAELERVVEGLARTIAANAPLSLRGMKQTILRALAARDAIDHADLDQLAAQARRSRDAREGVRAMLEKRAPDFRGEWGADAVLYPAAPDVPRLAGGGPGPRRRARG